MNEATTTARMTAEPLRLLYADEWFVAVHKPEGLLVHRSPPSGSPFRTSSRGNVSTSSALRRRAFSPLCERWAAKRPPVLPAPPASGENKKRSTPAGTGAPLRRIGGLLRAEVSDRYSACFIFPSSSV